MALTMEMLPLPKPSSWQVVQSEMRSVYLTFDVQLLKAFIGTGILFLGKAYVQWNCCVRHTSIEAFQLLQRGDALLSCYSCGHRLSFSAFLPLTRRNKNNRPWKLRGLV
jgi:hypothetical protein